MSNYNVGDIIRLTRQAIGMSQEELSDNICSVQTLSRIENGKVTVKRKIYQQLMERMGRNGSKSYAILIAKDFGTIDIIRKVKNLIFRREYEAAEEYVIQLKSVVKEEEVLNVQFLERVESVIGFYKGEITEKEYLENLEEALEPTVKNYKEFFQKTYPFTIEEIRILMNIATIYGDMGKKDIAIPINYMLIRSLNAGYMSKKNVMPILVNIIQSTARMYGGIGEYQIAINMCQNAIKKAKASHLYSIFPTAYGEIAWNMLKQIEKGQREKEDMEICKKLLRQGHAAATLSKQYSIGKVIEKHYRDTFGEEIYSLGNG